MHNPWGGNRLFDVLDGEGGGDNKPEPKPARKGYVTCDFCECTLTQGGEVYKMSAKAKKYGKVDDTIAEMEAKISTLQAEVTTLKAAKPAHDGQERFEQSPSEKWSVI